MTLRTQYPIEYEAWKNMRGRCIRDERYVKRGITVCERWMWSFETFLQDMGPKPHKEWSLDRIDNDGNYEPGNCRWTDFVTQQNNKSNNRKRVVKPKKKTYQELIDERGVAGLTTGTLCQRINRYGWTMEQALKTPLCSTRGRSRF